MGESRLRSWNLALTVAVAVVALAVSVYAGAHPGAVPPTARGARVATVGAKESVWDGVYTEDQAVRGQQAYQQECAQCHMDDLLGDGLAPALVGSPFFLQWSGLTVGDLLLKIQATMPEGAPDSLGLQSYADIVTYLLKANKLPAGTTELPTEIDALKDIVIEAKPTRHDPPTP